MIFRDFATTGDGQLTAIQLLSILAREKKQLSDMEHIMTRYPQRMINIAVSPAGRLAFYADPDVKHAIDAAKKEMGRDGRIVVRLSGTEPLVRVMIEGQDMAAIDRISESVAQVIRERLEDRT